MGVLGRIRESLSRTKQQIVERFDEIVRLADAPEQRSRPVDVDTIDALEELLISADIGVAATARILKAVKTRSRHGESLRDLVKQEIRDVFAAVDRPIVVTQHPKVTLVVGVNGTGKTTTIGKLANLLKTSGQKPLICAADTFRLPQWSSSRSGRPAPALPSCGRAKAPIPPRWCSTRSRQARRRGAIRFWWTRRGGCTRGSI